MKMVAKVGTVVTQLKPMGRQRTARWLPCQCSPLVVGA